ncbi:MAG: hypothetical protein DMG58_36125 [Acidobacteria bacterium]|nr:MAG: hypothetical protein DMG58_36125 [Acidobacteriota bacterium]
MTVSHKLGVLLFSFRIGTRKSAPLPEPIGGVKCIIATQQRYTRRLMRFIRLVETLEGNARVAPDAADSG